MYAHGDGNESWNKYRKSYVGDKYGKACPGDKHTFAFAAEGLDEM